MSTATHSPGPWKVSFGPSGFPRGIIAEHEMNISGAVGNIVRWNGIGCPSSAVAKANANLIAAAPDLLAALRRASSFILCNGYDAQDHALLNEVSHAIAKAEGRS